MKTIILCPSCALTWTKKVSFLFLEVKNILNICKIYVRNDLILQICNFQSLEAVDRGSETQLQVTENVHWTAQNSMGQGHCPESVACYGTDPDRFANLAKVANLATRHYKWAWWQEPREIIYLDGNLRWRVVLIGLGFLFLVSVYNHDNSLWYFTPIRYSSPVMFLLQPLRRLSYRLPFLYDRSSLTHR